MSDFIVGAAVFLVAFISASFIAHKVIDLWREPKRSFYASTNGPVKDVPMYCRDCGKTLISYRSMDGYDTKSGKPSYSFQRACSDASNRGTHGQGNWPYCGNRAKQDKIASGHNHEDPESGSTACPACVDVMLRDGVINYQQALGLYGKMMFVDEPKPDPDWATGMLGGSLYRQYLAQGGSPIGGPSKP